MKYFFILFSTICFAQTNKYKEILLSKIVGKIVSSYKEGYGTIYNQNNKNESIVDSLGNITYTSPINSNISHLFKNKFILYLNEKNYKRKEGVIDEKGNLLIAPDYQNINGWWNSGKSVIITKVNKDALFDFNGKVIIPFSEKIEFVNEDSFFVKNGQIWQLYSVEGKLLTERKFKEPAYFENDKALIINEQNQSEIIDLQGKTLHVFSKYRVSTIETYPLLEVIKNEKLGLIDLEENLIVEEEYNNIFPEYSSKDSFIYLQKNNKRDVFSLKDNKLYLTQYNYLNFLFDNFFSTYNEKFNKKGLIKINSEVVFPQEYDVLEHIKVSGKDYLFLEKDKNQKLLDENFNSIFDFPFDLIAVFPSSFILKSNEKYYSINPDNKDLKEINNIRLIKKENHSFFPFLENYSKPLVCKNQENLYGILNENLKEIIPFVYDDIITFSNSENEIVIKKSNKFGVTNYENEPLKDIIYDKYQWLKEVLKLTKDKKTEFVNFTRFDENKDLIKTIKRK